MAEKPTYEELAQKIRELEQNTVKRNPSQKKRSIPFFSSRTSYNPCPILHLSLTEKKELSPGTGQLRK